MRLSLAGAVPALLVPGLPGGALAHGIGSRADLPLPFAVAVTGAVAALVLTFAVLGVAWREPRVHGGSSGRALPRHAAVLLDGPVTRRVLAGLGLAAALWTVLALLAGPADTRNAAPFVVFVLLWVGIVPLSVLLGPATYRRLNPVRTVHALVSRAAGLDPRSGLRPLPDWGWWPGAIGLGLFVWYELVLPDAATVPVLRVAVLLFVAVHLLAGFAFGSRWFERGDPFEVWSGLFGRLSPLGRRDDGRVVLRTPLAGLDQLVPRRGLVTVVVVMLGSTAYDSVREHPRMVGAVQQLPVPRVVSGTLALLAVVAVVGLVFVLAARAAGHLGGRPREAAGLFAPSLVPIALGYVVAHYWSLLVVEGQRALLLLADPLAAGWDVLGLAGREPATGWADPTTTATVQVVAVVAGHVLGVVLAHERAVALFPRRTALLGQVPLLVVMVAYTWAGLLLLFAA